MESIFVVRKGFLNESECQVCKVMIRAWCGATLSEAERGHICHPLDVMVAAAFRQPEQAITCHTGDTSYWLSRAS
jgi:hypothetical protein